MHSNFLLLYTLPIIKTKPIPHARYHLSMFHVNDNRRRADLALANALQLLVGCALLVVELHVLEALEGGVGDQVEALAARVRDALVGVAGDCLFCGVSGMGLGLGLGLGWFVLDWVVSFNGMRRVRAYGCSSCRPVECVSCRHMKHRMYCVIVKMYLLRLILHLRVLVQHRLDVGLVRDLEHGDTVDGHFGCSGAVPAVESDL